MSRFVDLAMASLNERTFAEAPIAPAGADLGARDGAGETRPEAAPDGPGGAAGPPPTPFGVP